MTVTSLGQTADHATGNNPRHAANWRSKIRNHRTSMLHVSQVLIGVIGLALWELLTRMGLIDPFFIAPPSDIIERLGQWIRDGSIWNHLGVTMLESFLALVIGGVLGLALGFLLGRVRILADLLDPYIKISNAMPRVVLAPLFLLWFGLGIWSKVVLGVTLVFFIVFFNTYQGIREVDRVLIDNSRMLHASERQLLRHVYLPSALTWIFASLHVSVGFAIVGAVIGEYLGASRGMGYMIAQAQGTFDTAGVFAGLVLLAVVVSIIDVLVHRVERHLLSWKPDISISGGAM